MTKKIGAVCGGPMDGPGLPSTWFLMNLVDGEYMKRIWNNPNPLPPEEDMPEFWRDLYAHADGGCNTEPVCTACGTILEYDDYGE
jgi:hypothetical protein